MQSDYAYMNDVIYTLTEDVKIVFHTVASFYTNNSKAYSNCTEFKINNKDECNTMIKRNISYYLFIEDRRTNSTKKTYIYPEHMFQFLDMLGYVKRNWYDVGAKKMYAYLDNTLTVLEDECLTMKLPIDMAFKIAPGVMKKESAEVMCVDIYLNTPEPVQISIETFYGFYYVLKNLDMLNYANMALSFMMLRTEPFNRVDFSQSNSYSGAPSLSVEDNSTASGSSGREFNNGKKRTSILDR